MSPAEPTPLRAVLFDLDGTLVDSHPALRRAYQRFVSAHGGTPSEAEYQRWNGPPLANIVAGLQRAHAIAGEPAALLAEYVALLEGSYVDDGRLAVGALELLDALAQRGVACALVTSAPAQLARAMLAARGVGDRFAVLSCGDEVAQGKPAPDGYLAALARLGVAAAAALAIEDTPVGVSAACAAGLRCLGVGPLGPRLLAAGALAAAVDLHEVGAIVAALQSGPGRVLAAAHVSARVEDTHAAAPFDPETEARVAERWREALGERPALTDGAMVSLLSIFRAADGSVRLEASLGRYRHVVAQKSGLPLGLRAIGVTGVTLVEGATDGPHVVLGRRSREVTQYPGRWELVPSGGVDRRRVAEGGEVDLRGQLLEELREELGVVEAQVRRSAPLGVIEDLAERVVDVAFVIEVAADVGAMAAHVAAHAEYDELRLLPLRAALAPGRALDDLAGEAGLVPTVRPLLGLLQGSTGTG